MLEIKKAGHIDALDGIRALAIIMILLFHYNPSGFEIIRGGFIGVDMFFVLSGYLITMLLINEWQKEGVISLKKFWLMRIRRLLPAVVGLLVILISAMAIIPALQGWLTRNDYLSAVKYLPDVSGELFALKSQVIPAICYYINWHFIFEGKSYFELMDRPSLLGHLWSLSIEEQFYLVWPLLLMILFSIFGYRKALFSGAISFIALLSAYSLYLNGQAAPADARAYFGTDSRAYALMAGALVSIYFKADKSKVNKPIWKSIIIDLGGMIAIVMLGWLCWHLTGGELFVFRGGLFLATFATVIIIIASLNRHSIIIKPIFSNPILGWIGKRSYGLYLWHWPIFILTEPQYNYPLDGWHLLALRAIVLVSVVEFSYRYIENPFRYGSLGQHWQELNRAKGYDKMRRIGRLGFATVFIGGIYRI